MSEDKKGPPISEAVKGWKPLVESDKKTPPTSEVVEDEKPHMSEDKKGPPISEAVKSWKPLVEPDKEKQEALVTDTDKKASPPTSEAVVDWKPLGGIKKILEPFWSWSKPQRMQVKEEESRKSKFVNDK